MNVEYFEEKKECIEAVQKDRKFADLPKIPHVIQITFSQTFSYYFYNKGYLCLLHWKKSI